MVVNIRGANGSGKSHTVRALMEMGSFRPVYDVRFGLRRPEAYVGTLPGVERDVFILGPYDNPSGGCDSIPTYDLVVEMLQKYGNRGHVIFEGFLISTCWGAVGDALERGGRDAAVLFLTTPLEVCIARVKARRAAASNFRPFNPNLLTQKHATIARLKDKFGTRAMSVHDRDATGTIMRLLSITPDSEEQVRRPGHSRAMDPRAYLSPS